MAAKTKKFDEKNYELKGKYPNKAEANWNKKWFKDRGFLARVEKVKSAQRSMYGVYVRKK